MTGHELHGLIHTAAAFVIVVGGGVLTFDAWCQNRAMTQRRAVRERRDARATEAVVARAFTLVLVSLSVGAAVIHLAAAPAHLVELGWLGFGFPVAAALQAMWAGAWWLRPTRDVAFAGIALHGAIAMAWLVSRTLGLPAGDTPWVAESVTWPDLASTLFEVVIVALLVARLTGFGARRFARLPDPVGAATIAAVPAIGVVLLATLLAVNVAAAPGGEGHDHGDGAAHTEGHAAP